MRQTQKNYVGVLIDGQNRFYEALTAFNKMHNLQFKFNIFFFSNDINLHNFCMDYNNTTEHVKPFINSNHNDSSFSPSSTKYHSQSDCNNRIFIAFVRIHKRHICMIYDSWFQLETLVSHSQVPRNYFILFETNTAEWKKNLFQFSNVRWSHAVYIFEVLDCDNSIFCKRHWAGKKDGYGRNG